jgi:hypothetical protein
VEPRREHVVEAGICHRKDVLLGYEHPVSYERDPPDAEAGLEIGRHLWERRRVLRVAVEDVVRDRDAV